MARVAQARPDAGAEVERADGDRLLELRGAGDDRAGVVDRDAVAVEDELVLAADGVAEQHRHEAVARPLAEHPLALRALAVVVRGGRQVDDDLGAGERLGGGRRPRLPDVLADRQADRGAVDLDRRRRVTDLEVALLVEDAVVGQAQLAVDAGDIAVGEHGRRVVDVVGALREADDRDDVDRLGRELGERARDLVEEVRLEQQVLGRVARQRELGEEHERRSALARLDGRGGDLVGVAGDVADRRVDLGQRAAQRLRAQ